MAENIQIEDTSIEETTFPEGYDQFGSTQEQLDLLTGCKVIAITLLASNFQEYAVQMLRMLDDPISIGNKEILLFILSVINAQPKPENSMIEATKPQYIFLKETLVPEEKPDHPYGPNNIPKVQGYRIYVFYRHLHDNFEWGEYLAAYLAKNKSEAMSFTIEHIVPRMRNVDEYLRYCSMKNMLNYTKFGDLFRNQPLHEVTNRANPIHTLSLKLAMFPKALNIAQKQRTYAQYCHEVPGDPEQTRYFFPDPKRVKRYNPAQIEKFMRLRIPGPYESENIQHDYKDNSNYNRLFQDLKARGFDEEEKKTGKPYYSYAKYQSYIADIDNDDHFLAFAESDQNQHTNIDNIDQNGRNNIYSILRSTVGTKSNKNIRRTHEWWLKFHKQEKANIFSNWKRKCQEPQYKNLSEKEKHDMLIVELSTFWEQCASHFMELWTVINEEQSPYKKAAIDWKSYHYILVNRFILSL